MTDPRVYPRVIASVWGLPKTGKTHFAFSFPKPLHAIEIGETGVEDLASIHPDWDIRYRPLIIPNLSPSIADHEKMLAEFEESLNEAVNSDARTLIIDSFSRLWRSVRLVKTEEGFQNSLRQKRNQADYELANDYIEQVIQVARRNRTMNIVLVHRHRDIFRKDGDGKLVNTGEAEARDYRGMDNLVQVAVRTEKREFLNPKTREKEVDFGHVVELCRFNAELQGVMVRRLDYDKLMGRIFDGT